MFQKSIAIYLAVFIGIGIDPGCCLRAWISNAAASVLTAPFQIRMDLAAGAPSETSSSCCQKSCCVDLHKAPPHADRSDASRSKSHCVDSGHCCKHRENRKLHCIGEWNGEDDCKCVLTKPIDSFSWDVSAWSPVLLYVWFSEPMALPAGLSPASDLGEIICVASPHERLAELCRWNC